MESWTVPIMWLHNVECDLSLREFVDGEESRKIGMEAYICRDQRPSTGQNDDSFYINVFKIRNIL